MPQLFCMFDFIQLPCIVVCMRMCVGFLVGFMTIDPDKRISGYVCLISPGKHVLGTC